MMNEYGFEVGAIDTWVAFDCEGDRADRERMTGTAKRQHDTALHLRNAHHSMTQICPPGHTVRTRIVVDFVVDVNAGMYDHIREGRTA